MAIARVQRPRRRARTARPRRARPIERRRRRPARTPRNREQTTAAIVAAAADLTARKGPDGFGLAELGTRAGVSFGLIHRYFGGKRGLLREALRRPFTRQLDRLLRLYEGGARPPGSGSIVALLFEAQRRNPDYVRLIAWGVLSGLLTRDLFAEDRPAIKRLLALYDSGAPGIHSGVRRPSRSEAEPGQEQEWMDVVAGAPGIHSRVRRPSRSAAERGQEWMDVRAVSALLLTATLGFQLFRPLLQALFEMEDGFEAVYRRHLETALGAFRGPPTNRRRRSGRARPAIASARDR